VKQDDGTIKEKSSSGRGGSASMYHHAPQPRKGSGSATASDSTVRQRSYELLKYLTNISVSADSKDPSSDIRAQLDDLLSRHPDFIPHSIVPPRIAASDFRDFMFSTGTSFNYSRTLRLFLISKGFDILPSEHEVRLPWNE
jgi:hypothetical protein